jgi:ribosome modulation factor
MSDETPSAGHNSELSEAEKQALFLRGLTELEGMIADKDEIMSDIRNQRKRIISYGFTTADINFALGLRKKDDAESIEKRRREAMIARFLGHPIGTQADIFDELDRTPAADKALAEGKIAGAEGQAMSPPYDQSTEQGQQWLKGWQEGQADLASGFKKLEAVGGEQAELEDAA